MVLYLIDNLLRVFDANAQCKRFGFNQPTFLPEKMKDITSGVSGRNDDMICFYSFSGRCTHRLYLPEIDQDIINTAIEPDLTTEFQNGIPHVFDDVGKFVRTNMRTSIYQNIVRCTTLYKNTQHLIDVAALIGPGIQFTI